MGKRAMVHPRRAHLRPDSGTRCPGSRPARSKSFFVFLLGAEPCQNAREPRAPALRPRNVAEQGQQSYRSQIVTGFQGPSVAEQQPPAPENGKMFKRQQYSKASSSLKDCPFKSDMGAFDDQTISHIGASGKKPRVSVAHVRIPRGDSGTAPCFPGPSHIRNREAPEPSAYRSAQNRRSFAVMRIFLSDFKIFRGSPIHTPQAIFCSIRRCSRFPGGPLVVSSNQLIKHGTKRHPPPSHLPAHQFRQRLRGLFATRTYFVTVEHAFRLQCGAGWTGSGVMLIPSTLRLRSTPLG